jgi:3D (Asp-Asp-Asp) domain-containing protein
MDVISKLETRGNISTRLKQISSYADDITGRMIQVMIDMFMKVKNEASKYGSISK